VLKGFESSVFGEALARGDVERRLHVIGRVHVLALQLLLLLRPANKPPQQAMSFKRLTAWRTRKAVG
jgi:hypothetical protein